VSDTAKNAQLSCGERVSKQPSWQRFFVFCQLASLGDLSVLLSTQVI
jgi:hypothetical protein